MDVKVSSDSSLALTFSAEDCPGCNIILGCLPSPPISGLPLPTLLNQPTATAPMKLMTINAYRYATTVSDCPVNIDSLLFYFDDQREEDLNYVNEHVGKVNQMYFCTRLDVYAGPGKQPCHSSL